MIVYGGENKYKFDASVVGGKGLGLYKLLSYGLAVPDFFVIASGTDITDPEFLRELDEYAQKLDCDLFSVRSSGVTEDGGDASYAGQYSTELNVKREGLIDAVRKVSASRSCRAVAAYAGHNGGAACEMAIIVQKQIIGAESGVMFSTSPHEIGVTLIESVKGLGESLVGGAVTPDKRKYAHGDNNAVGYDGELLSAAALLEENEGVPVDVEWAYDGKLWFLQLRPQTAVSDVIPEIADCPRNLYVHRDFSVLCHSVQERAARADVQHELFGFCMPITDCVLVCGREFYSERNDEEQNRLWGELDKGDFFDRFALAVKSVVEATKRRCSAVKNNDYSQLSDAQLFAEYEREMRAYINSYVPMMMRPDDYLYEKITSLCGKQRADALVTAVKALLPPTYYSEERKCFLSATVRGDYAEYLQKYEWKNNPLGKTFSPLGEREVIARACGMTCEQAQAKLDGISQAKARELIESRRALKGVSADESALLGRILEFTYYRTLTAENSDRYFYYIRKQMIGEISRRMGLPDETLMLYRYDELAMLGSGEKLAAGELIKRKSGEAIIFSNGESKAYYGANAYALLRKLMPPRAVSGAVHGEIACAGEVTGIIKIVSGFSDAESMAAGCILVASMTTPDISLAMEKAAGIITDEGGITCHAAIIAREYAVPCLVGTKIATRVLRDGMRVKLDCVGGFFTVVSEE